MNDSNSQKSDNSLENNEENFPSDREEYEERYDEELPDEEEIKKDKLKREHFKNMILKLRNEKPIDLQNSFEKNTIQDSAIYLGDYRRYSLLDSQFNHFGSEEGCINVKREPGQIIFLFISSRETDYREYNAKLLYEIKQECKEKYHNKVAVYHVMTNTFNKF